MRIPVVPIHLREPVKPTPNPRAPTRRGTPRPRRRIHWYDCNTCKSTQYSKHSQEHNKSNPRLPLSTRLRNRITQIGFSLDLLCIQAPNEDTAAGENSTRIYNGWKSSDSRNMKSYMIWMFSSNKLYYFPINLCGSLPIAFRQCRVAAKHNTMTTRMRIGIAGSLTCLLCLTA